MAKVKHNLKTRRLTHIRAWRLHRGLTLERMAERLNVTAGSLSQLERGTIGYTQAMLEALAEALSCEPADLISRPPGTENGLSLIWDQIPVEDREKALNVLKAFTKKTGTTDLP